MAKKNRPGKPTPEELEKKGLIAGILESESNELTEEELEAKSVEELKLLQVKPTPDGKKPKRETFPLVGNESTEIYPFTESMPDEFDFEKYPTLKRKDFVHDHLYFEHKALEAERKVAKFRELAEEAKKLGSTQDRARAKKLLKTAAKMAELKAVLEAGGYDVDALLAGAGVESDDEENE